MWHYHHGPRVRVHAYAYANAWAGVGHHHGGYYPRYYGWSSYRVPHYNSYVAPSYERQGEPERDYFDGEKDLLKYYEQFKSSKKPHERQFAEICEQALVIRDSWDEKGLTRGQRQEIEANYLNAVDRIKFVRKDGKVGGTVLGIGNHMDPEKIDFLARNGLSNSALQRFDERFDRQGEDFRRFIDTRSSSPERENTNDNRTSSRSSSTSTSTSRRASTSIENAIPAEFVTTRAINDEKDLVAGASVCFDGKKDIQERQYLTKAEEFLRVKKGIDTSALKKALASQTDHIGLSDTESLKLVETFQKVQSGKFEKTEVEQTLKEVAANMYKSYEKLDATEATRLATAKQAVEAAAART